MPHHGGHHHNSVDELESQGDLHSSQVRDMENVEIIDRLKNEIFDTISASFWFIDSPFIKSETI